MTTRAIMFQGTGSDVGKSLMVAGLCRLLTQKGLRVAPFKAQNMSNNAAVTVDGGEIGRAQWLQAVAAKAEPSVHMNPVLLKPQSDRTCQVIVQGKLENTLDASNYQDFRATLLPRVLESYYSLAKNADIILVEGAGSPAEINLRDNDIANMGFARAADCPVVLIGDIDRGGVIASVVGTHTVLPVEDRDMIKGFIINKFRGDPELFTNGAKSIEALSGWPYLGLVPYQHALMQLPQEDSISLVQKTSSGQGVRIVVLLCPHIANFDDIDPLTNEPDVNLSWCKAGEVIPADADLVILAGSKSTIADLNFIKAQGWDIDLRAHHRRGGRILGICGGYQMLGKTLSDPHGMEGDSGSCEGLGFLDVNTIFTQTKTVTPWQGRYAELDVSGYEIHLGQTQGADCTRPLFTSAKGAEGAISADGRVMGSYIHGVFAGDAFRRAFLQALGAKTSSYNYNQHMQDILDAWADVLATALSIDQLIALSRPIKA